MNHDNMDAFYRYVSIQYGHAGSIAFDEKISELGSILGKTAKSMVNEKLTQELSLALGYYINDINPHIQPKRKSYPAYLQLNILTFEFLSDFLLFAKYPDKNHCVYIFSKYRKNRDAGHHTEYAAYYNKLHQNFQYQPTFDWWNYVPLAANGIYFLLFHEWAHINRSLVSQTFALFERFDSTILFKIPSFSSEIILDNEIKEEIACDFVAWNILDSVLKKSKSDGLDAFYFVAQAIACIPLYSLIGSFSHGKDEYDSEEKFYAQFDEVDKQLETRLANLSYAVEMMLLFSHNIPAQSVVQDVMKDIFRLIQIFYEHLSDFWVNELLPGFNTFASQNIEERKKYYLSKNISPLIQIY